MTLTGSPEAQARARARWSAFADRLRSVTPQAVGRGLLAIAAVATAGWVAIASWPALVPFVAGALIAYAVLPIANRLSAFMPRVVAALLAELVALAILAAFLALVIPPLVTGLINVASRLPTQSETETALADLQAQIGQLDEPIRGIVMSVAIETVRNLQVAITDLVTGLGQFASQQILGFLGTVSFVLGLLVIPAWILTLVADERPIKRHAAGLIAPAIRADVVALFRIVDRAFATFLRVRVRLAITVGVLIWLGLVLARQLGVAEFPYAVTAATLLGTLQLVPELGYFLGFLPIVLVLAVAGPIPALTVVLVYMGANRLASEVIETRVSRGVLDVHPGLLIPAIVALSQFGLLWTLAAAPIVAIVRDTVRYLYGRLGDPPAPANVLPGETAGTPVPAAAGAPIPSAYRAAAERRSGIGRTTTASPEPPVGGAAEAARRPPAAGALPRSRTERSAV